MKIGKKPLTKEEFVARAKAMHGDKYNYDKAVYVNGRSPITITCPIHGDFVRKAIYHSFNAKAGCPQCSGRHRAQSTLAAPLKPVSVWPMLREIERIFAMFGEGEHNQDVLVMIAGKDPRTVQGFKDLITPLETAAVHLSAMAETLKGLLPARQRTPPVILESRGVD